ncbi:alginate export family protein [Reichenbachiella sp.]|uniref:alginate export family protein n=1 Tax=Reichenbachiella sp. TaxID=2184521 RepID=UPI003297F72A
MKKSLYTLVVFVFCINADAEAQFSITGEVRPRAEFRNGFKKLNSPDTDPAFFIEQRTRLNFNFKDEKYAFSVSLQDVRLWGENSQIYKSDNSLFNVYEAWGTYNFSETSSIKVGRQALNYDNARFLGNLAWAQQSRSHDLIKFQYKTPNNYGAPGHFEFHIGAAFNQEDVNAPSEPARLSGNFYSGVGNYKTMQYTWLHKDWGGSSLSFLMLNNGLQAADSTVHFSQTIGLYSKSKLSNVTLTGEVYYQMGNDISDQTIRAYLASLNVALKIGGSSISIGGDVLSGTDPGSSENNSFNPLYGTNHKFYGFMDYFYVGNSHRNAGLIDIFLNTKFKTGGKSAFIINLHEFRSHATILNESNSNISSRLGTEVDLVFNLNIADGANLKIGYSQMFATDSMQEIKGGDSSELHQWAWTMFTIKPTLFKEKSSNIE